MQTLTTFEETFWQRELLLRQIRVTWRLPQDRVTMEYWTA